MITISLCMSVKNEASTLPRCLDTVGDLADEIIIVDTGSTDNTMEIAKQYTDLIYQFEWCDNFSAARNYAFAQASMEYCMWLDADDVLEPEDQKRFQELKAALPAGTDMVMLPYHTAPDEDGRPAITYYRERLVRREAGFRWEGAIHEAIAPSGTLYYGAAAVTHRRSGTGDPDRNLRIFEGLRSRGIALSPREQFYYARELTYHGRDAEAAQQLEAFLQGGEGWIENCMEACRDLAACYQRLGQEALVFPALSAGLRYGPPRAELCCDLGQYFMDRGEYRTSVFWYELALTRPKDEAHGGFSIPDCHDYIPFLQLCVCWYRLGDVEKSKAFNRLAANVRPHSTVCQSNFQFFENSSPQS